MDKKTLAEYRARRAEGMTAKQARYCARATIADRAWSRAIGFDASGFEFAGLTFTIEMEPDCSGIDWDGACYPRVEWIRGYGDASDIFDNAPDFWTARDGRIYARGDRNCDRAVLTWDDSIEETAAYYRKSGMARGPAWEHALAMFRQRAEHVREAWRGEYGPWSVSVTVTDADGNELACESLGGCDGGPEYLEETARELAQQCVAEIRKTDHARHVDALTARADSLAELRLLKKQIKRAESELIRATADCELLGNRAETFRGLQA